MEWGNTMHGVPYAVREQTEGRIHCYIHQVNGVMSGAYDHWSLLPQKQYNSKDQ